MKKPLIFSATCLSILSSQAGTIALPYFETSWDREGGPGQARVMSEETIQVNLDDRADLTPGQDIRLTVSSPDRFLWLGGFHLVEGPTTISSEVTLTMTLGNRSISVTANLFQDFGDLPPYNPSGAIVSDPAGYIQGETLSDLVIIVPWDTDLSQASFTFTQDSEITGENQYFNQSTTGLSGGTVQGSNDIRVNLQSIPEPGSASLLLLSCLGALAKRRR